MFKIATSKIAIVMFIALFCLAPSKALADDTILNQCYKNFGVSADNTFLLSLSVLNKLNYDVTEIQSKSGYALFNATGREYILSVTSTSPVTSIIKIYPTNSALLTDSIIQTKFFQELDFNKTEILKRAQ